MDAYETILWILRIIIVLIASTVLAILLALVIPRVDTNTLQGDVLSARVAYAGGDFILEPGIIDKTQFTQAQADRNIHYTTNKEVGIKVWLEDRGTSTQPIYYNREAYNLYTAFGSNTVGVERDIRKLPCVITEGGNNPRRGLLVIEVLYAK